MLRRSLMADPLELIQYTCALATFAYKHGPTHRLDKAKNYLSNVLIAIEDHRKFKPDKEVRDLLHEYDK